MSGGCTDCGRKGGCDGRKTEMFAAIDEALALLYPTRRWSDRAEPGMPGAGAAGQGRRIAELLAARLGTVALPCAGGPEECCDYVYVLCVGRAPALIEVREGHAPAEAAALELPGAEERLEELYLRVALSALAPVAAVQQVAFRASAAGGLLVLEEAPRAGVFDPILLPRLRTVVAVLAEAGLRHLDFGEIVEAPAGFDPGDYGERYGGVPAVANYLFYPQPCSSITTVALPLPRPSGAVEGQGRGAGAFP